MDHKETLNTRNSVVCLFGLIEYGQEKKRARTTMTTTTTSCSKDPDSSS